MRIALITIPRSGSSFYSRRLAKKYKVGHAGELFHFKALTKKYGYDFPLTINDSLRVWGKGNCVAKIFTRDFIHMPKAKESLKYYEELVYGSADKIVYLYRNNLIEHLKSMITADFTDVYMPYKEFKEIKVDVTKEQIFNQLKRIELDIKRLDELQERFPGKVVSYEDFATEELKYKYNAKFYCDNEELPEDLGLNL
tara:strand:+ start:269 stop:859 length:591 start_codon:yes stop_codon:yes gene_type:complete